MKKIVVSALSLFVFPYALACSDHDANHAKNVKIESAPQVQRVTKIRREVEKRNQLFIAKAA